MSVQTSADRDIDDEASDELKRLRERAYGRHADIFDDPEAQRRLAQLEADAAQDPNDTAALGDEDEPVEPPAQPASEQPQESVGVPLAESAVVVVQTGPHRGRAWMLAFWVVSIAVTAWAAVVLTNAAHSVSASTIQSAGGQQIGSLSVQKGASAGERFGGADAKVFGDFHGYTVIVPPAAKRVDGATLQCISVVRTDDYLLGTAGEQGGRMYSGCGAGRYPASVIVPWTLQTPAEIRTIVPDGAALMFVLDGSAVRIYADR